MSADPSPARMHAAWLRSHADILDTLPCLATGAPGDGAIADQMRMAADELDRLCDEAETVVS